MPISVTQTVFPFAQKPRERVYIAGPMTGIENKNRPAFESAKKFLAERDFDVVSPIDLDDARGTPAEAPRSKSPALRHIIREDIAALTSCDAIFLLPGWEQSLGARGELAVADWYGLRVTSYEQFDEGAPS